MTDMLKIVGDLQAFLVTGDFAFNVSEIVWVRRLGKGIEVRLRDIESGIHMTGPDADAVWEFFQSGSSFD